MCFRHVHVKDPRQRKYVISAKNSKKFNKDQDLISRQSSMTLWLLTFLGDCDPNFAQKITNMKKERKKSKKIKKKKKKVFVRGGGGRRGKSTEQFKQRGTRKILYDELIHSRNNVYRFSLDLVLESFCSLIKGITPKIRILCCILINILNLLCV